MLACLEPCVERLKKLVSDRRLLKNQQKLRDRKYSEIESSLELSPPNEFEHESSTQFVDETNHKVLLRPRFNEQLQQEERSAKGSAVGQNIKINRCHGSKYYLLRILQNAYIDNCQDCNIFLGPCKSTVFIRNCRNVMICCISQQLRIEDSNNVNVSAILGVKPVLENSSRIYLSALSCRMYSDLIWQIQVAKIDPFNNQIFECYDFTPKKNKRNFYFLTHEHSGRQKLTAAFKELRNANQKWENKLDEESLIENKQSVSYLPTFIGTKKSLIKTIYAEDRIMKDLTIIVMVINCSKEHIRHMLELLSADNLRGNYEIIASLDDEQTAHLKPNLIVFPSKAHSKGPSFKKRSSFSNREYYHLCIKCRDRDTVESMKNLMSNNPEAIHTIVEDRSKISHVFSVLL